MVSKVNKKTLLRLKEGLVDYLSFHGVNSHKGFYKCVNPEHDDSNPSSSIYETDSGPRLHCFSCGYNGDIFSVAHSLNPSLPITGRGLFEITIPAIANDLGYEVPIFSSVDQESVSFLQIYGDVSAYISSHPCEPNEKVLKEINKRGWTDLDRLKKLNIGFIPSYNALKDHLKSLGHSIKMMEDAKISDPNVFNENRLIYCINDDSGNCVGFIARNVLYEESTDKGFSHKYIYNKLPLSFKQGKKENRLYLLDKAKSTSQTFLYAVEGQADAASFHYNGYDNFISISGSSLNESHLDLLRRNGIFDLVVCFDNDEAGQKASLSLIKSLLKNVHDVRVRFVFLPSTEEKLDPELMIRNNRQEEFFSLVKYTPFDLMVQDHLSNEHLDTESFIQDMVNVIISDPSPIRRDFMAERLSEVSGVPSKTIKEEILRRISDSVGKIQAIKNSIVKSIETKLAKIDSSSEAYSVLAEGIDSLDQVDKEFGADIVDSKSQIGNLLSIKNYQEAEISISKIESNDNVKEVHDILDGDLSKKLVLLSSAPNLGKTTLFVNLIHSIATNNSDCVVAFLTIDDSLREILPRFLCYDSMVRNGIDSEIGRTFEINHFALPTRYRDRPFYSQLLQERTTSYKNMLDLLNSNRLKLFDSEHGRSYEFLSTIAKNLRAENPNKRVFIFLDNLHLLTTPDWTEQGNERIKKLSHETKQLCVRHDVNIFSTAELRKLQKGQTPELDDLSGSASLGYDSNAAFLMWADMDIDQDSGHYFYHNNNSSFEKKKNPIASIKVAKNKIGAFKGIVYAKIYAAQAYYQFITSEECKVIASSNSTQSVYG